MSINKSIFTILLLMIFMTLSINHCTLSQEKTPGLIATGATLKLVQSGFQGAEGPVADADGNIYFTDTFPAIIYKWTWEDGNVTIYKEKTGKAHGLVFDDKGRLVISEFAEGRVTRDDMKGNITVLADSCDGKKLHTPNKLWIDPKGGIYFSDMYVPAAVIQGGFGPDGASRGAQGGTSGGESGGASGRPATNELGIVYISPDGKKVICVANDLESPNGLVGTPDGKILYVGDLNKVWSYKINADGTLTDKKLFCENNTDGMAIDKKNNIYLTNKYVSVYSPRGELLEEIPTPDGVSNLCFGGKDRKTLFLTHGPNVYTLEMLVKGAPTALDLARGNE